jgi:hypothetical protein
LRSAVLGRHLGDDVGETERGGPVADPEPELGPDAATLPCVDDLNRELGTTPAQVDQSRQSDRLPVGVGHDGDVAAPVDGGQDTSCLGMQCRHRRQVAQESAFVGHAGEHLVEDVPSEALSSRSSIAPV